MLNDPEQREEYDQIRAMGSGARFSAPGASGGGGFDDVFSRFGQGAVARRLRAASTTSSRCSTSRAVGASAPVASVRRRADSAASEVPSGEPTSRRARRSTSSTAAKGETITLQGEDNVPFKVKIPAGVSDGQKIRLRGRGRPSPRRRREGRHRGDRGRASAPRLLARRPQPAGDGPRHLHRGGARCDHRGADLGGDPVRLRVAPGTPSGRVLRVKGRGIATPRAPATSSPRCRSPSPRTWTTPRAKPSSGSRRSNRKRTPRADLMAKARKHTRVAAVLGIR